MLVPTAKRNFGQLEIEVQLKSEILSKLMNTYVVQR